jgi:hypothetical protein
MVIAALFWRVPENEPDNKLMVLTADTVTVLVIAGPLKTSAGAVPRNRVMLDDTLPLPVRVSKDEPVLD